MPQMKHLTTILDKVASELEARGLRKLAAEIDVVANTMDKKAYGITMAVPVKYTLYTDPKTGATHYLTVANTDDDSYVQSELERFVYNMVSSAQGLAEGLLGSTVVSVPDMHRGGNTFANARYVKDEDLRSTLGRVQEDLKVLNKYDGSRKKMLAGRDISTVLNPIAELMSIYNDDKVNRHLFTRGNGHYDVQPLKDGFKDIALLEEVFGQKA